MHVLMAIIITPKYPLVCMCYQQHLAFDAPDVPRERRAHSLDHWPAVKLQSWLPKRGRDSQARWNVLLMYLI